MVNSFNDQLRWNLKRRMRGDLWVQFSVANLIFTVSSSRLWTINMSRVVVVLCLKQTSNWRCKSHYVNSGVATVTLLLCKIHWYVRHTIFFLILSSLLGHETQLESSNRGWNLTRHVIIFRKSSPVVSQFPLWVCRGNRQFQATSEKNRPNGYKRKPYGLVNKIARQ